MGLFKRNKTKAQVSTPAPAIQAPATVRTAPATPAVDIPAVLGKVSAVQQDVQRLFTVLSPAQNQTFMASLSRGEYQAAVQEAAQTLYAIEQGLFGVYRALSPAPTPAQPWAAGASYLDASRPGWDYGF